jgi:GR25 family glycosyltransferase involved in LPS biosynthesis
MINKTFIINLSHDTNRKNDMIEKLKKTNIKKFEFFNAINGMTDLSKYDFKVIYNWNDYFLNRPITIGEIGCALSHYNIWKNIVDNNINKALILEDDVIFKNNFNEMLDIIENLEFNYDIFYLSRKPLNVYFKGMDEIDINDFIVECKSSYNLHSYIITYECAKILINCNFLNNLLPVDDFLSILYDKHSYPFKEYINYFKNCKSIKAYSLKNHITDQENFKYESLTKNSPLYINYNKESEYKNIREQVSTWTIDTNICCSQKHNNFIEEIYSFLDFSHNVDVVFGLNMKNDRLCFIEKLIYDNVMFHSKRLNININNIYVSFWTKSTEYYNDYIHMHIDHCDYESRIYNYEKRNPLFTSIIYFNDNNCPTLITDITKDMYNIKDMYKINNFSNNNKLILSFPKVLKNTVFDSGKYYHGESYLSDYDLSDRKTFVIAVWDEENKPLYVPFFDRTFYYYYEFSNHDKLIHDRNSSEFDKETTIFNYKNRDNKNIIIKIDDNNIINYNFFYDLIIERKKTILYGLSNIIFKNTKDPDTVIIDFSNILIKRGYDNMICYIGDYNLTTKLDANTEQFFLNELFLMGGECLLDTNKQLLTILEKYVYDISLFHINSLNMSINDFYISFKFINNNINNDNFDILYNNFEKNPFMSCITFLEDYSNPILITDITKESYMYKNFESSKLCLINPTKFLHVAFSGKCYFNIGSCTSIILNFWKKPNIINIEYYNNKCYNIYNKFENIFFLKKQTSLPKQLDIKYNNIFEDLLYKKKLNSLLLKESLKNENIKENNIFILNILNEQLISKQEIENNINLNKIDKLKFII